MTIQSARWALRLALMGSAFAMGSSLVPAMVAAADPAPAQQASPLYTPDTDPYFAQPYIDIDEWRSTPVRHRYVHGGFKGTDTRFSFYLPPKEQYRGRFYQHITPVPDSENLAQKMPAGEFNKIGSTLASGAYFVETNGGGAIDMTKGSQALADPTITAYRANAAAAAFSRTVALKMYGGKRPYGYAYGGSGGGYRTIGSIENTQGVWDGVVPYVIGSTMAIPNMFTVRMQALRVLRDKFPGIVDAAEPGGSGNPYAGLTDYEASVLHEVERMGFPMKSWFGYKTMGLHGFAALYGGVSMADPTYFTDFWTKPGYLGHDHPELLAKDRMQFKTTIGTPVTAADAARQHLNLDPSSQQDRGGVDNAFKIPEGAEGQRIAAFRLASPPPPTYFLGGELIVTSGAAKGKRLMLSHVVGDTVVLGFVDPTVAAQIRPGDEVQVDNSNFLAMESYHRHQVPGPDFPVWDQFRGPDGKPLYPQRPMLLGPLFTRSTSGSTMTGRFQGKMIVVASLWDREAMPWQADWYRRRVEANLGAQADSRFRLWYTDHALHGDEPGVENATRIVSYVPILQQALNDLAAWVEKGTPPPASTRYRIADGQVIVPPTAAERQGVQPVVTLTVKGGERVDVPVGQPVTFVGTIAVPPGAGSLVGASWDFDGKGLFATTSPVAVGSRSATVTITHSFDKPGTYFPALQGIAQREGDSRSVYRRIRNLGRVRVVVQ